MKTVPFFILFCLLQNLVSAQGTPKALYAYDAAGNRISRTYLFPVIRKTGEAAAGLDSMATGQPAAANTTGNASAQGSAGLETAVGEQQVGLYPNPTQGFLSISLKNFNSVKNCKVEITDLNGRSVYSGPVRQATLQIDLSNEPAGIYLVNLWVNGKQGYYAVVKE